MPIGTVQFREQFAKSQSKKPNSIHLHRIVSSPESAKYREAQCDSDPAIKHNSSSSRYHDDIPPRRSVSGRPAVGRDSKCDVAVHDIELNGEKHDDQYKTHCEKASESRLCKVGVG